MSSRLDRIEQQRQDKLNRLKEAGINPYPYGYHRTHTTQEAIELLQQNEKSEQPDDTRVSVAGRIMAMRNMGKLSFLDIHDSTGKIQLLFNKNILAEENFNGKILKGLLAELPELDIVLVQDTEMYQSPDPELLEWAAEEGRILLTHEIQTIIGYTYDRVRDGLPMPGVIEIRYPLGIGVAIEELVLLISASTPDEFENQVRYIPLT